MSERGTPLGIGGLHTATCPRPRFLLWRFRHKVWICECGTAWRRVWMGGGDGGIWTWEEWR